MALRGSMSTSSYDGRYYTVYWTATQSIEDNTSKVSYSIVARSGNSSWYAERTLNLVINGKSEYYKTDRVERYAEEAVVSDSTTITHNSDGTASLTISLQVAVTTSTINCTGSKTFTLDTIPRKSTLTVSNGTLGTAQTITVTRQSTSFTHTVSAQCGDDTQTICTKSTSTSLTFTPPLSWASQNTTGTSLTVTYRIATFNGDTSLGSGSYVRTVTIPTSVKPSCSIAVSDPKGYASTYGGYIKNLSTIKVVVTPTLAYGSKIASYSVSANGEKFTTSTATTSAVKSTGTLTISATVTDKRGRSGSASTKITALDYSQPSISKLSVKRCNSDGTENANGAYVQVTFSATATSLSNKNTTTYYLGYKKTSASSFTQITTTSLNNTYAVTDAAYIFAADTGSSYDVKLTVTDAFSSTTRTTTASTGFSLIHFLASGLGMAFGKIAEVANLLDIGFKTRFSGGILQPILSSGTDLNNVTTPNTYTLMDATNYSNCPMSTGTGTLTVETAGENGQLRQLYSTSNKTSPNTYERHYYSGSWGNWVNVMKNTTHTHSEYAAASHNHAASAITSGTLPVARGGTGQTAAYEKITITPGLGGTTISASSARYYPYFGLVVISARFTGVTISANTTETLCTLSGHGAGTNYGVAAYASWSGVLSNCYINGTTIYLRVNTAISDANVGISVAYNV